GAAAGGQAMMGRSDGLSAELGHVCRGSGVGARVAVDRVRVDGGAREIARALGAEPLDWGIGGGEDYELLLTCDAAGAEALADGLRRATGATLTVIGDRKSTRLNSSHVAISYAVFCLKKKNSHE